jgi:N-acetylmuramoyl-L-alanine amidase
MRGRVPLAALAAALLVAVGSVACSAAGAGRPLMASEPVTDTAPDENASTVGTGPSAARAVAGDPPGWIRVPKPQLAQGPRRIGIQAGHWRTEEAPPELGGLIAETGTSWNGVREREINLDMAQRVAALLQGHGYVVDVLPTIIPPGYLADAFVSLHGDGDGVGEKSGFKIAHSTRRTQYEEALQKALTDEYAAATGLAYDADGVTRNMSFYYAFNWMRVQYATAPHTPSVILEMGFVSNDRDRWLLTERADSVADGIASGIVRFLADHPRDKLFERDLLVQQPRSRSASPSPSPGP